MQRVAFHSVQRPGHSFLVHSSSSIARRRLHILEKVRFTVGGSRQVCRPQPRSFSNNTAAHKAAAWYEAKLESHPIVVKAISSAVIAGAGDLISQGIIERSTTQADSSWWDPWRTARFVGLGAVLVGPLLHHWFGFLAVQFPSKSVATLVQRVVVDQFMFSPLFVSVWVSSLWTLEGHAVSMERMRETIPGILVANWMLWIPAQLANFRYVPVQHQVLASNFVALAWNSYLSYSTNRRTPEKMNEAA